MTSLIGASPNDDSRLAKISTDPVLICFSHLRWNFVYQRPQHLLTRAARRFRVFYFEEPLYQPGVTPRLELSHPTPGVTVTVPILPDGVDPARAEQIQRKLLHDLVREETRYGSSLTTWYYTPMAFAFSNRLMSDLCVYDCMDELSAFAHAPPSLARLEKDLFDRADLVFTGGHSLFEAKQTQHKNVHAMPSSIDSAHFGRAREGLDDAADQVGIPRPRIGFFGVIDERMDIGLVDALAAERADWQFMMVGPVVKIDPSVLPRRDNLHWLGSKSYAELPHYLSNWDAGFMPFALNEATRFISPTKTPEFLAAGVPLASTPIRDVVRPYGESGVVGIASTSAEMAAAIEFAMARPREAWLADVDRMLSGQSWDRTWNRMASLMLDATRGRRPFRRARQWPALTEIAGV